MIIKDDLIASRTHNATSSRETDSLQSVSSDDSVKFSDDQSSSISKVSSSGNSGAVHICEMCGMKVNNLPDLKIHRSEHHGNSGSLQCTQCGRAFVRHRALEQHERRHVENRLFSCYMCDAGFNSNGELTKHRRTAHVVDDYQSRCEICNVDLKNSQERSEHRAKHRDRVSCPECGKTFTLERSMRVHVATFHSEVMVEKPFECDICGRSFVRANLMLIHRRTHTGEKPFQCEVCGRRFICRGDLSKHNRLHVNGYMYKCTICGKECKTSRESADHRRMHTSGINCPICDKSFTRYLNMQAHVRGTHQGERRFGCQECGKTFVYPQNLRYHRRQHQGSSCSQKSTTQAHLRKADRGEIASTNVAVVSDSAEASTFQYRLVCVLENQSQLNSCIIGDEKLHHETLLDVE